MRFMTIYKAPRAIADDDQPPSADNIARMGAFIEELAREGVLLVTDGLASSAKGARVRSDGGKITVVDGPFAESKELVAGYAIINVGSKAEAIEVAKRFLAVVGDGESEVREMYDAPAFDAGAR